ncbi:hypothetical protein F66182_7067 [Fusarium sp. NRRL 66182]|nr:hypothetical protein F66182_7067 [Fusarium sp. NRRL 66182]
MCNWNVFTFTCGCFKLERRDQVREEWIYPQGQICKFCKERQDAGAQIVIPPPVDTKDLIKIAYEKAKSHADKGDWPTSQD